MAIVFACTCGSTLKAREDDAGKRTKCPRCGKVVPIPRATASPSAAPAAAPAGAGGHDAIAVDLSWPSDENGAHAQAGSAFAAASEPASIQVDASVAGSSPLENDPLDAARPTDGTRQYKILQPKDYGLAGKFNPVKLEETLNFLARKGWAVKSSVVIHVHSHGGEHDELIVLLER